jgi:hypothetical protein
VGQLHIISPREDTRAFGGGDIVVALQLVDQEGRPIEGATVHGELWTPGGELLASFACTDKGQGQYVGPNVTLPLRGTAGTWSVQGTAIWGDSLAAEIQGAFIAEPSISEMYLDRYGFWIEYPRLFGLGTGFYNLSETGGLHFEDNLNEDGSGFVILDNYRYQTIGVTFAALEVHWQYAEYPADQEAAVAFAQRLAGMGLHHQDPDTPILDMNASTVVFQGRPAWQVIGTGSEYYVSKAAAAYPVEWLIFSCPDSDWIWSLAVHTDNPAFMDHLRSVRESFVCPVSGE